MIAICVSDGATSMGKGICLRAACNYLDGFGLDGQVNSFSPFINGLSSIIRDVNSFGFGQHKNATAFIYLTKVLLPSQRQENSDFIKVVSL